MILGTPFANFYQGKRQKMIDLLFYLNGSVLREGRGSSLIVCFPLLHPISVE